MAATEPDYVECDIVDDELDPTYPETGILRQSSGGAGTAKTRVMHFGNPALETLRAKLADAGEMNRALARLTDAMLLAPVVEEWLDLVADEHPLEPRLPAAAGAAYLDDGLWVLIAAEAGTVVRCPDSTTRAMVRVLLATGGEA